MPDETATHVLAYIGMGAIAFLVLRLITAPYFVWMDEKSRADQLDKRLSGRPSRALVVSLRLALVKARDTIFSPAMAGDKKAVAEAYEELSAAVDALSGVEQLDESLKSVRSHAHGIYGAMFVHDDKSKIVHNMEEGRRLAAELLKETAWAAMEG